MNQKVLQANFSQLAELGYMRYPKRRSGGRSSIRQSLKKYAAELNRKRGVRHVN